MAGSAQELAAAYLTLIPTLQGAESKINQQLGPVADTAGKSAGGTLGGHMSGGIMSSIKDIAIGNILAQGIMSGAAAIKDAITGVFSDAFNGIKDYEQLAGGVETLFSNEFGDASQKVKDYADEAYLAAGMSANEYMQNVTSFSASLISGLGGDVDAAADVANQAMIDMADNANKMGTDMQSIVGTYQSLARGNYAMLDNLKLGYGGTKAELERLMADAEALSGKHYTMGNFADTIEAIHVIQDNLGIAGATSEEAMGTIEGSMNTLSAAWSNFLTGLGRTDVDMTELTDKLIASFEAVVANVAPAIARIFVSLIKSIPDLVQSAIEAAPEIGAAMVESLSEIFAGTPLEGIAENATVMFEELSGIITPVIEGVQTALAGLWEGLQPVVAAIMDAAPQIWEILQPVLQKVGEIVQWVGEVFAEIFPPIAEVVGNAIGLIVQVIQAAWTIIGPILDYISPILDIIGQAIVTVVGVVTDAANAIIDIVQAYLMPVIQGIAGFVGEVVNIIMFAVTAFVDFLGGIVEGIVGILRGVGEFIMGAPDFIGGIVDAVVGFFTGLPGAIEEAFRNLFNIITAPFRMAFNAVAGFWNDTIGQLQWDVPDWVPVIGGNTIGAPKLPILGELAEGAIATRETQAIIGEGTDPEALIPLNERGVSFAQRIGLGGPSITREDIAAGVAEGFEAAGIGFYVNGEKLANITRSDYDRSTGSMNIYNRRGLAYG